MPKFLVSFSKCIDYDIEIEAKDANTAERLVDDGRFDENDAYNISESISVASVEEIE